MAKASSMRWYGHVLRKEDENVKVKALKFEVSGSRGRGRPKQTRKKTIREWDEEKWTGESGCMWSNKMARRDKDIDHMKSGQLRRRGQYRIRHLMMKMMMIVITDPEIKTAKIK